MPAHRVGAAAAAALVFTIGADAARVRLSCIEGAGGSKVLQPEAITDVGPGQVPEAVVAIVSARLRVIDAVPTAGLNVAKTTLTPQQAYGAGLPNGYTGGGPVNPAGPWVGLMWPFRDFNDRHADPGGVAFPPGNDVGAITTPGPGTYLVSGIGGAMAFSTTNPASYMRGMPGNGGSEYAAFFSIDVAPITPVRREVTVFLEDVVVRVLIRDELGRLMTEEQPAPGVSLRFEVPAPGAAAPLLLGLLAARRRR